MEKLCRKRILSQPLIWSQRQLNSHAREELEGKSILLRSVWRGIRLTLSHQTQIMTQSRGGYASSREISWCMGRRIAARVAGQISGGRAQGHTKECRIRVEGELRKTEEEKARLRAAASRVGDAPKGRALKRVRFADNNAGEPEPTSESAPSNLPAEAASSSSAPTTLLSILHRPRLQLECRNK